MQEYKVSQETLLAMHRIAAREEEFRRKLYGEDYKSRPIDMKEILGYDPNLNLTPEKIAILEQRQLNELNRQIAAEIALMRQEDLDIINVKKDKEIEIHLDHTPIPKSEIHLDPTPIPKSEVYFNPTFDINPNYQPYDIPEMDPETGGRKF